MSHQVKIALVLGFSLCLLVAVVISDHFSQARSVALEPAPPIANAQPLAETVTPQPSPAPTEPAPLAMLPESPLMTDTLAGAQAPGAIIEEMTEGSSPEVASVGPVVIANGPTAGEMGSGGRGGLLSEALSRSSGVAALLDSTNRPAQAIATPSGRGASVARVPVQREEVQAPTSVGPAGQVGQVAQATTPGPKIGGVASLPVASLVDSTTTKYTVKPGDTLYELAARALGNGNRWREIREMNRDVVPADGTLRVGMRLVLPRTVEARPAAQPKRTPEPRRATPERAPNRSTGGTRYYVVKPGDTLGLIAQRELGTVHRKDDLLKSNASRISDEDQIFIGMKLELPG